MKMLVMFRETRVRLLSALIVWVAACGSLQEPLLDVKHLTVNQLQVPVSAEALEIRLGHTAAKSVDPEGSASYVLGWKGSHDCQVEADVLGPPLAGKSIVSIIRVACYVGSSEVARAQVEAQAAKFGVSSHLSDGESHKTYRSPVLQLELNVSPVGTRWLWSLAVVDPTLNYAE